MTGAPSSLLNRMSEKPKRNRSRSCRRRADENHHNEGKETVAGEKTLPRHHQGDDQCPDDKVLVGDNTTDDDTHTDTCGTTAGGAEHEDTFNMTAAMMGLYLHPHRREEVVGHKSIDPVLAPSASRRSQSVSRFSEVESVTSNRRQSSLSRRGHHSRHEHKASSICDFEQGVNAYGKGEFRSAFRYWKVAAKHDHALACANIGAMYLLGRGTKPSRRSSLRWTRRAIELCGAPTGKTYFNII